MTALTPLAAHPARLAVARRVPAVLLNERFSDEILKEDKPDPVFDGDSGYTGKVWYGFSNKAENINGKAAMMGFVVAYLQELISGKGILTIYGLPYDEGAVITNNSGDGIPGLVGLVVAVVLTIGFSFAGVAIDKAVGSGKDSADEAGFKMPDLPGNPFGK